MDDKTGKIICVDATCITVANEDGSHHSRSITAATKVRVDGEDATLTDLNVGDFATLIGDPVEGIRVGEDDPQDDAEDEV